MNFDKAILIACVGIREAVSHHVIARSDSERSPEEIRQALMVGCLHEGLTVDAVALIFDARPTEVQRCADQARNSG
jgi:hypothetical protein